MGLDPRSIKSLVARSAELADRAFEASTWMNAALWTRACRILRQVGLLADRGRRLA
jgi:hypothetical protein